MTLIGYSVNASAIELDLHDEEELVFEHEAVRAAVAFWLIIKLTRGTSLSLHRWGKKSLIRAICSPGAAVLRLALASVPQVAGPPRSSRIRPDVCLPSTSWAIRA